MGKIATGKRPQRFSDECGILRTAPRVFVGVADAGKTRRLKTALEGLGCDVVAAHSGFGLLEQLADCLLDDSPSRPDALVAEAILPGCTGLSLLAGLRDLQWDLPIVLLASRYPDDVRERAVKLGASAVVDSAGGPTRVSRTVRRLLDKQTAPIARASGRCASAAPTPWSDRQRPTRRARRIANVPPA